MTYLVERLAELRRHLDHLTALSPKVVDRDALARDLSLHNDVLFSLLLSTNWMPWSASLKLSPLWSRTRTDRAAAL